MFSFLEYSLRIFQRMLLLGIVAGTSCSAAYQGLDALRRNRIQRHRQRTLQKLLDGEQVTDNEFLPDDASWLDSWRGYLPLTIATQEEVLQRKIAELEMKQQQWRAIQRRITELIEEDKAILPLSKLPVST